MGEPELIDFSKTVSKYLGEEQNSKFMEDFGYF